MLYEVITALGLGKGSFPVVEKFSSEFVSLPMFPELGQEQIEFVVRELGSFFDGQSVRQASH